ncbi:MAG: polyprenyl synthetase family protein [Thermodesulfovibrio sp.]|nr:polyprenyl synthetase family protein [Thermodesulfovibrio sp.]MDW7998616.1 polyprenyl synthetase family protein [Thermodesulfovibrio sp.]
MSFDLKKYIAQKRKDIDEFINSYFNPSIIPSILHDSVLYSLTAGGKRLRPILCIASYEACDGNKNIVPYATAIEFIHTYSLIHDDLPAMDNDDLRRGKPTNHKVFGEGIAILAGDGLLTEAFTILANPEYADINPKTLLKVIYEISKAAGLRGMVAGQAYDLISEGKEPDEKIVEFIHVYKTAAMIKASVKSGAILAEVSEEKLHRLETYGHSIGLAFQIIDDILDIEGTTEEMGKPKGSDIERGKMTYPRVFGIENSKNQAKRLIEKALQEIEIFGEKAEPLREIAKFIITRTK